MFRTARGFLLIAPPAFAVALAVFLLSHGRAAESFSPYPFLADALGPTLVKRPVGRFAAASTLFFVVPYLVSALLLLLSDAGVGAATRLWAKPAKGKPAPPERARRLPPEALVVFAGGALLLSGLAGAYLDRVAHGGELPGGVNIAPLLVAAIPFLAVGVGLVLAAVASLPRAVARVFSRGSVNSAGTAGPAPGGKVR